jgi:hypothetical protein
VKRLDDGIYLYTAVVWSVSLKRKIRLAYLLKEDRGRCSYIVLFSTDLDIDPFLLYRCYTARFQIEFIFRDARQYKRPINSLFFVSILITGLPPV